MLHDMPGIIYTHHSIAAQGATDATVVIATCPNPVDGYAKVVEAAIITPVAVTGDDTNTRHFNLQIVAAAAEIANLDLATAVSTVAGVPKALTLTGTAAQLRVAERGVLFLQSEKIGSGVAILSGTVVRIGWKSD